jgi:phospholipase/carboxylesterase
MEMLEEENFVSCRLERAGYEVRYREFDGGHVVPPDVAREAASWFADRG